MVPWGRHSSVHQQRTPTGAAGTTYGEVFQVDHDGEGHPQGFIGRHHTPSQRDDALKEREGRAACITTWSCWRRRRTSGGFAHLGVDVEEAVALKVPPLVFGIVEQEAVFDDEEPGAFGTQGGSSESKVQTSVQKAQSLLLIFKGYYVLLQLQLLLVVASLLL